MNVSAAPALPPPSARKEKRRALLLPLIDSLARRRKALFIYTPLAVLVLTGVLWGAALVLDLRPLHDLLIRLFKDLHDEFLVVVLLGVTGYMGAAMVQLRGCFSTVGRLDQHARHVVEVHEATRSKLNDATREIRQLQESLAAQQRENKILGDSLMTLGQQFHTLAEISGDIFWTLNADGTIRHVSRTVTGIFGFTPEELRGHPAKEYVQHQGGWSAEELELLNQLLNGKAVKVSCLQTMLRGKNGQSHACTLHAVALQDEHGNINGFSGILLLSKKHEARQFQERVYHALTEEKRGFLDTLVTLDEITGESLRSVVAETETAAFQILTKVQGLDRKVSDIMAFLMQTNEWTQSQGSSSRRQIEEDREAIKNLQSFVDGMRAQKINELDRANQVVGEIDALGGLVEIIHTIGEKTNVLALNARIIAARSGEMGKNFAVVANEVRKLSTQVQEAAEQIGTGIEQATRHIRSIFSSTLDQTKAHASKEEQFLASTAQQMIHMGENYAKLLDFNENTLRRIQEWNQEISHQVMELMSGIQFQDITRQQLEQIVRTGARRMKAAEALKHALMQQDAGLAQMDLLQVEDLYQEYVMEGQREIHLAKTGMAGAPRQEVQKIELF